MRGRGRELHLTSDQVEYRVGRMGRLYRRWLEGAFSPQIRPAASRRASAG